MALQKAKATEGVMFGRLDMYTAGGGVPEGDYIWKELSVKMHQYKDDKTGKTSPARLGIMITLASLSGGEDREQFYSLGTKAHESFAPNPETGKGVIPVPGGPATTFNMSTNWAILLKSLYDSGLPQGIFEGDVSVLEGMHVHMANVPEPAERAGFQSQTGEVSAERKPGTIAVVTEIKDDGKPWEGTGGVPEDKPAAKANGKVAAKVPAAKVAAKTAPEPEGSEDTEAVAISAISTVLEKNPKGCAKLILRTGTFKAVNEAAGAEMAQAVINGYFSDDATLNGLLGQMGFALKGTQVVEA